VNITRSRTKKIVYITRYQSEGFVDIAM